MVNFHDGYILSMSSSEASASRDNYFVSPAFHELLLSVMNTHHIIKVKQQGVALALGSVTV